MCSLWVWGDGDDRCPRAAGDAGFSPAREASAREVVARGGYPRGGGATELPCVDECVVLQDSHGRSVGRHAGGWALIPPHHPRDPLTPCAPHPSRKGSCSRHSHGRVRALSPPAQLWLLAQHRHPASVRRCGSQRHAGTPDTLGRSMSVAFPAPLLASATPRRETQIKLRVAPAEREATTVRRIACDTRVSCAMLPLSLRRVTMRRRAAPSKTAPGQSARAPTGGGGGARRHNHSPLISPGNHPVSRTTNAPAATPNQRPCPKIGPG